MLSASFAGSLEGGVEMAGGKMSVLVLGGTGAMGVDLVRILAGRGMRVTVTSRSARRSDRDGVTYVKGTAKDDAFLAEVLRGGYDCVVDFMSYGTEEFSRRAELLLRATDQYVFISSARVYAPSAGPLTEGSPLLLDACDDEAYLATDEYALAKARQERLLAEAGDGFTVIRPSLTYNSNRLQFAVSEKEEWLWRALRGRAIVLPSDMAQVKTTMAWGREVAEAIAALVCSQEALGQTVHVAGPRADTWQDILGVYQEVLRERGCSADVLVTSDSQEVAAALGRTYQIKYARAVSRVFDCGKLEAIAGCAPSTPAAVGLRRCLEEFLDSGSPFLGVDPLPQACFDSLAGEHTLPWEFGSWKDGARYLAARYTPYYALRRRK